MTITAMPHVLNDLLALSHVPRWVIVPRFKEQSVADHSFRVAVIYLELCFRLDRVVTITDLVWALMHDGPESWTGDIPGPFKTADSDANVTPWWHQCKSNIPAETQSLVKLADLIEGATWISKWGTGHHAAHATLNLRGEAAEKAREVAEGIGYGSDVLEGVVRGLVNDILHEIGRVPAI